ncbi:MAG: glycosyltransferase family 4 protein [Verrucomicrobiota bacterium]
MARRHVLLVQEHTPAFRREFYEGLKEDLASREVDLTLVYAPNQRNTFLRADVEWALKVPVRRLGPLSWQSVLGMCSRSDLAILMHEIKYAMNPVIQFTPWLRSCKLAYWGHGKSYQSKNHDAPEEKLKRWLGRRVDWWFAYNKRSASAVEEFGFPPERITAVGNAIDTRGIQRTLEETDEASLLALKSELGVDSENVAVYTGSIRKIKRIGFLLESARKIRETVTDFHLIIIGDGPDASMVRDAAAVDPWIHWVGRKTDVEKVPYWAISKVSLMPGAMGLGILDSFALGVPMVTCDLPNHGPEVEYFEAGVNGEMIADASSSDRYAEGVVRLLTDEGYRGRLVIGARSASETHSIERMVGNFSQGVMGALEAPRIRGLW